MEQQKLNRYPPSWLIVWWLKVPRSKQQRTTHFADALDDQTTCIGTPLVINRCSCIELWSIA